MINTKQAKNLFNNNIWIEAIIFTKKFPKCWEVDHVVPIAYFKKDKLIYLINSNFKNSLIKKFKS